MIRTTLIRNLASLLWAGWRRRYLIIVPIVVLPIVGLVVGIMSPKRYETYTTILFQEAAEHNPFLEDLSIATNLKSRMDALNALLHSRHILASVASEMALIDDTMDEREKALVIHELSRSLQARLVGDNLIKISYQAEKRARMAQTLTLVSTRFVERVLAPQRSSIIQSESFLARELEQRRHDLEQAEISLADYKNRYANELPTLHSSNVARLAELKGQLAQRRIELEGARAARNNLAQRLSQTNPVIGKIEEAIIGVMAEVTQLRARYTDQHSRVQAALARLSALEQERNKLLNNIPDLSTGSLDSAHLQRLWVIASSTSPAQTNDSAHPLLVSQLQRLQEAEDHIQQLTQEVDSLSVAINDLQQRVSGFGQHERKLNELSREIEVRQKIYQDLSERHELARVTGSLGKNEEHERVKIIDPPFEPLAPSNLSLLLYLIAGLAGGIGMGLGLALISELLDTSIRRKETLTQMLRVPVLARIPPITTTESSGDMR